MRVRIRVTADELALSTQSAKSRDGWVEKYENEIKMITENTLSKFIERYENNPDDPDREWVACNIRYLKRKIAHKRNTIKKLMAMKF